MKRDMELVRKLVLFLESNDEVDESTEIEVEDYDHEAIRYHLALMGEAGLLNVTHCRECVIVTGITWQGHEFADLVRDPKVWQSTLTTVAKKTGSISFDIIVQVLKGTIATLLLP